MPFLYVESVVSLAQELKDRNIRTFAAHLHGKNSYDQESYTGGTAFLIGNEGKGLTDEAAWVQLMKYEENVIAFMRKTEKPEETVLAVCNFAAIPYENYNVGVPFAGKYKEIFNSDDKKYGGNGVVNTRVKAAKKAECDEREYSITLKLPALGVAVGQIRMAISAETQEINPSMTTGIP